MPTWMKCPRAIFTTGRGRSVDASHYAPINRVGAHGLVGHGNKTATKAVSNGGLMVRGGAAAVSAGGPLGGVLFATAVLSAVLERSTKAGEVVGAPLLSFTTFCILRCRKMYFICCIGSAMYC